MKRTDKALAKLATTLPSTTDILRGSLLQRRIRHRSGCAVCASGEGHLISVLTVSYPGGRTKQISLRPEQKPIVEQWLRNYRQIKATLERICTTNLEIVFLAQRFFSSRLGNQLFEGGVTRREDGIEDQTSVFGDLITMRVGKFLNQPVGAQ